MSWLAQCFDFGEAFYGVFDKDILRKIFNARKGFHITEEELERLCNEFPADMTECHLEEGQAEAVTGKSAATVRRYFKMLTGTRHIAAEGSTNNIVYHIAANLPEGD